MHRTTNRFTRTLTALAVLGLAAGAATAQPTLLSLGTGTPVSVTDAQGGVVYVGGAGARWVINGSSVSLQTNASTGGGQLSWDGRYQLAVLANTSPQITGNTATGVSPAFSTTPTLVTSTTAPATTESAGRRFDANSSTFTSLGGLPVTPSLMVYGSGSNGSSTGTFLTPNAFSPSGRYVVGYGYISTYSSSAGTAISASTFQWRPFIWDAQGNAGAGSMTVLPTPFRTSSNTWRRRTGNAYAVSNDGTVIVGAQEHNAGTAAGPDPDGARPVVWRLDGGSGQYQMSYLPNGQDAQGNYYTMSSTPGTFFINSAGTIIVGRAVDGSGFAYIAKWTWNAGTSSWNAPVNLGSNLSTPASWLPVAVTSCGVPPSLTPTGMSDDGSIVVGTATYSTCGSFMSGGWIWRASDGLIQDWYDFLASQNVPGLAAAYGPVGDNGDPNKGLPKLGFPSAISPDGTRIVGFQGGTQRIPGAVPWLLSPAGAGVCAPPVITSNPSNLLFSRCSFGSTLNSVILSVSASGTAPFTYQWTKGGVPLSDGATGTGSTVSGANSFQLRITLPGPADAGSYACVVTGCNGATATSASATAAPDPAAVTPANDACAGAVQVAEGTVNFNPCGAYANDGFGSSCTAGSTELVDLFYRYVPTFTGDARFQSCASTFDTFIQVLDGCNGSELACNNDVGSRGLAGIGASCSSTRSVISRLHVTAGVPVIVRVGGIGVPFSNSATSGALTIGQAPAAPANDHCENATLVSGNSTTPFDLAEADDDYTVGTSFCSTASGDTQTASNRDVWFRLNAPCGGTYTISTCGSTVSNPMLHVFDDGCPWSTAIACSDNVGSGVSGCTSNQARITNLTVSGPVRIRVSVSGANSPGTAANAGQGTLTITGTDVACPGACCNGSSCSISTQSACAGTFAGANTTCGTVTCCTADFNGVNGVDLLDIFAFLNAWFSGCTGAGTPVPSCTKSADYNHMNGVDLLDIFAFLNDWFRGC